MHFGIFFHGRAEEAWEKVTKFSRKAWQQALVLLRVVRPTDGRLTDQYLLGGGGLSPLLPWCTERDMCICHGPLILLYLWAVYHA